MLTHHHATEVHRLSVGLSYTVCVYIHSLCCRNDSPKKVPPIKPTSPPKKNKKRTRSHRPLPVPNVIPPSPTDILPPPSTTTTTTTNKITSLISLRDLETHLKSANTSSAKPLSSVTPWDIALVVGSQIDCIIVQVNSIGEFYVQSLTYITQIQPNLALISPNQPSQSVWKEGERCLARFPNDRKWYRGEILEKLTPDTYKVAYIDFGNHTDMHIKDLCVLPASVSEYQPCAVKASLAGVDKTHTWNYNLSMYFSNLVLDKHVVATVQVRCIIWL